jgi:hypothetical protein
METRTPVEVATRYSTTVDDMPTAWAFVMEHIDKLGPEPSVNIYPCWGVDREAATEEPANQCHFHVAVDGCKEMEGTTE